MTKELSWINLFGLFSCTVIGLFSHNFAGKPAFAACNSVGCSQSDAVECTSLGCSTMPQLQYLAQATSRAIDVDLGTACIYSDEVKSFIKKNQLNEALNSSRLGIQAAPNEPYFYDLRADLYKLLGNKQGMIADYSQIISILQQNNWRPELGDFYRLRGDVYASLGNSKKASEDYTRAAQSEGLLLKFIIESGETIFGEPGFMFAEIWQTCARAGRPATSTSAPRPGMGFDGKTATINDTKGKIATSYYKLGMTIQKVNRLEAIKNFKKALILFTEIKDKANQRKVQLALNSLK